VGIGLRVPHYQHIFSKKPVVNWFEIISENFMVDGGRPLAILDQILERYRWCSTASRCIFGSAEPLNREHLTRLNPWSSAPRPPGFTDHLCWGSVDGRYTHDLLPMPYTFEAAKKTAQKIREARDFLEVPLAVENVSSYAEFHVSEMTEWEFLNEVVEGADCGILLDVNNIYVSSRNHGFDPFEYLHSVPAERVAQSTLRATPSTGNTFSTRTIIPSSTPSGRFTPGPLKSRAPRRPCSSGTIAFPPSKKSTGKP